MKYPNWLTSSEKQICNNLHDKENNVFDLFDEQINENMAVLKNYEPLETI